MSNKSNENDFAALMSESLEVQSDQYEQRALDKKQMDNKLSLDEKKLAQRKSALGDFQSLEGDLKAISPETNAPQDPIAFKREGLQEGVYKKLRTGRYELEAKLDLHGLTVEQALSTTVQFIRNCIDLNHRSIFISHGKGVEREQPAKLKNYVAAWLKEMPEVMAYHSAPANKGGTGSVYVLLKKSEQKKQENRERFSSVKKR